MLIPIINLGNILLTLPLNIRYHLLIPGAKKKKKNGKLIGEKVYIRIHGSENNIPPIKPPNDAITYLFNSINNHHNYFNIFRKNKKVIKHFYCYFKIFNIKLATILITSCLLSTLEYSLT